jgi:hypothetical protein
MILSLWFAVIVAGGLAVLGITRPKPTAPALAPRVETPQNAAGQIEGQIGDERQGPFTEKQREPQPRIWRDDQGREVEATFEGLADGKVRIRKISNRKIYRFPLEKLSEADQQYVKQLTQSP